MQITIPNSWEDISWKKFEEIVELNKIELSELDKEIKLVSLMTGLTESEVRNLDANSYSVIEQKLHFLSTKPSNDKVRDEINLNGTLYHVDIISTAINAGQFLDFKVLQSAENIDKRVPRLLACFIYPKGHKYNDGYDVEKVVDDINEYMSVPEVTSLSNFFIIQFKAYATSILRYLERKSKKWKQIPTQEKKKIQEALKEGRDLINAIGTFA